MTKLVKEVIAKVLNDCPLGTHSRPQIESIGQEHEAARLNSFRAVPLSTIASGDFTDATK